MKHKSGVVYPSIFKHSEAQNYQPWRLYQNAQDHANNSDHIDMYPWVKRNSNTAWFDKNKTVSMQEIGNAIIKIPHFLKN